MSTCVLIKKGKSIHQTWFHNVTHMCAKHHIGYILLHSYIMLHNVAYIHNTLTYLDKNYPHKFQTLFTDDLPSGTKPDRCTPATPAPSIRGFACPGP